MADVDQANVALNRTLCCCPRRGGTNFTVVISIHSSIPAKFEIFDQNLQAVC